MKFRSWVNRPVKKFDKIGGKKMVETTGYIPAKVRIERMVQAGQRLKSMDVSNFDTIDPNVDDEDLPIDPSRKPGYDLADASAHLHIVNTYVKAKKAELKAKKAVVDEKKEPSSSTGSGVPDKG